MKDDEKQNKQDKNVQKVFKKQSKDQKNDSAGDVATHDQRKKKTKEKEERSDNKKENKGEESERRPSPLWIDWELTHHAAFQPINLIDQSSQARKTHHIYSCVQMTS